ncbi:hypothetical protein JHK82_044880 [Glycine max]|uniref:Uncharacterized protein n=1 Tax=Glycine max TaxID=3847 RepID=A0A0R0FPX0_SOYBN|nr:hypothetical protein JHK86_045288 [Glycine max]KAG4952003.1 hypothetical protein JHK85_045870 [Glycine max]KAG5099828.1 hypothetical protein JHK82_044880 [Glycine max]KAG5108433.1 hypothetical protein JHK84_045340 [Glycine max]
MIVVHALFMMQCSMEIGLSVWIWAKFLVRIACLMSLCLPDYFYTIGWREKKLVNTKGMLRAADFRIGKLITGNIHRLQDIYWLQVMCLIKCQDDIFGHVIRKKFSDKFPGITCTCRTNGGWSD